MLPLTSTQKRSREKQAMRLVAGSLCPHADALIDSLPMAILFMDQDNRVEYLNPPLGRLLGVDGSKTNWVGRYADELLGSLVKPAANGITVLPDLSPPANEQAPAIEIETVGGQILACHTRIVHDHAKGTLGRLCVFEDVTHLTRNHRRLQHLADHDALTGLYNRRRFLEELERALLAGNRLQQRVSLLIFDLDRFKDINDLYGHSAGDALLMRMAAAVSGQIRRNEVLARLGGDEFAILVPESSPAEVEALAERILKTVADLHPVFKGYRQSQSCSIGVAISPDHAGTVQTLMERAYTAL